MRIWALLLFSLAAATAGYSQTPSSSASRTTSGPLRLGTPVRGSVLSEAQLADWLQLWQGRLGLQDWKLEGRIVRSWDLPSGTVANIHWSLTKKTATVRVLHSADSTLPASEIIRDTELSVVHELVHLTLAKLPLDANHTENEEESVKKISAALLNLSGSESKELSARSLRKH